MFNSLKQFALVYYALMVLFMLSVLFHLNWLHFSVKPMFMILLMALHHRQLNGSFSFFSKMVQLGLFFSLIGDIALMFDEQMPILFVVGLGAFLVAHLGYALAFGKSIKDSALGMSKGKVLELALPFILFTGCFFLYIQGGLPADLYVPVLAYTGVISVMGLTAAIRHGHVDAKSYLWIVVGAVLFILSDCVIAINKFVIDFEYDAILNMILYLSGQLMIAFGAIFYAKRDEPGVSA
jgi:uncharacterized membrane protein YhhN